VYGEYAEIFLVDFIREEKKFGSLEELKKQINADKQTALNIFKQTERKNRNG
ncbi:MAG: riboflavin biosynthesis protein RibF, partial [Oscillospiraceae bacterium]|nr:riboflavin biosynthesis protein RibF [Oscillospiraceae bacterium]